MIIGPDHTHDPVNDELRAMHIAKGEPRYSVRQDLMNGGFVRRWSNDRRQALQIHRDAVSDRQMKAVFCFDHIAIAMLAVDFRSDGRSRAEISADCDAAIDRMFDRCLAD